MNVDARFRQIVYALDFDKDPEITAKQATDFIIEAGKILSVGRCCAGWNGKVIINHGNRQLIEKARIMGAIFNDLIVALFKLQKINTKQLFCQKEILDLAKYKYDPSKIITVDTCPRKLDLCQLP